MLVINVRSVDLSVVCLFGRSKYDTKSRAIHTHSVWNKEKKINLFIWNFSFLFFIGLFFCVCFFYWIEFKPGYDDDDDGQQMRRIIMMMRMMIKSNWNLDIFIGGSGSDDSGGGCFVLVSLLAEKMKFNSRLLTKIFCYFHHLKKKKQNKTITTRMR